MRYDRDREECVQCGYLRAAGPKEYGVPQPSLHYWFCSLECYNKALLEYIPSYYRDAVKDRDHFSFGDHSYIKEARDKLKKHLDEEEEYARKVYYAEMRQRDDENLQKAHREGKERELREFELAWNQAQKQAEKEAEMAERQFDKDYEAGEKEHQKVLDAEAFQEALKPKPIPRHIRYEHTHILGSSGSGKTSLLQQLILEDIRSNYDAAYVVVDPKGMMVERLSRLQAVKDRIIVIDPTKYPLAALDLFHLPIPASDEQHRARILTHLIETFGYIFSIAGARLTQRQSVPFGYVVRLVFSMGGNIDTLMDILEDNAKERRFYPYMQQLGERDRGARRFFENDFYSVGFNDTRQQIKTRLYEIISKPELMTMFAAGQNRLSIFDSLQSKKILLVNTAMPQLGSAASQLLGRYFIAMTLNAAFARFAIPKSQWTPAYLVIDEFQDFADEEKTPEMLRLAREYNLGVVIAHQNMFCSELNDALHNAISTNTSIKYCASPEGTDLGYMARDLRCEADFLKTQTKHGNIAKFACYVRGMNLTHPFSYDVELGLIDRWPRLTDAGYADLMRNQRERLQPHETAPKPAPKPVVEQPVPAPTPKPIASQPPPKTLAPQATPHTDPDHGKAGEPATKW